MAKIRKDKGDEDLGNDSKISNLLGEKAGGPQVTWYWGKVGN